MSRSLHAYYLDQMGIETWVLRRSSKSDTRQHFKLIVLAKPTDELKQEDPFSGQCGALLKKMIKSIGLSPDDIEFMPLLSTGLPESLADKVSSGSPQAILVMGKNLALSNHHYQGVPLVVTYHPSDLLMTPFYKKKAFQDLLLVRQFLT